MPDTILVTGFLRLDPSHRDAAVSAATTLMAACRAEDGVERYDYSADLEDTGVIYINEQYRDQAAMDAHMASPALATFMAEAGGFGISEVSLTKWDGATASKLM